MYNVTRLDVYTQLSKSDSEVMTFYMFNSAQPEISTAH